MKDSTAKRVARQVEQLPAGSFLKTRDVDGPRGAVEVALSRLTSRGKLIRVRRGLYWKGIKTPRGMLRPRADEIGLVMGGPGSGPAGVAAAHLLSLTTQLPSTYQVAVPHHAPTARRGLRFTQRPVQRLVRDLSPWEVAVLEVLRAGPAVMEAGWDEMADVTARLSREGKVRLAEVCAATSDERHRLARARWSDLCAARPELAVVA